MSKQTKKNLFYILGNLNPLRDENLTDDNVASHGVSNVRPSYTDEEYQKLFHAYMAKHLVKSLNDKRPPMIPSGYQLDDIMIQCTFNGRSCHRNLTSFFHPNYGNCYTFNNDDHVENTQRKDLTHFWSIDNEDVEDGYKLFLELYLYQNEYIPYLDDRAAFRIFIHRKHEIPILSQNSLFLGPTTFTKLIFSQRIISFSQQCQTNLTAEMKKLFNSTNVRYSQALCFKLCEFRFIEEKCKCTDQLKMVFVQFFSQNHTTQLNEEDSCVIKNRCNRARHRFSMELNKRIII